MNAPSSPKSGAARFVGARVTRKEDRRLLTGRGTYVDDIDVPGMAHCAFVRSPIAKGRIVSIDTAAALTLPGVRAVYTNADLTACPARMIRIHGKESDDFTDIPPMASGTVCYVGDPVALVIADSRALAEDGAALVEVVYEPARPVVTLDEAQAGEPAIPGLESNLFKSMTSPDDPGVDDAFARAAHVVSHRILHQRQAHSPMETRGVVAEPKGAELILNISCQSPHMAARYMSVAFDLPDVTFHVVSKDVGGAFGLKVQPWREEVAVVSAALQLGQPLKWIEDRYENLISANQAREQDCMARMAFDAAGHILAMDVDYRCNVGAYPHAWECNDLAMIMMPGPYRVPAYRFASAAYHSNTVGQAAYRGPWAMESLIRETLLDKAAHQIGIDAIDLRRLNLITAEEQPYPMSTGFVIDRTTTLATLEHIVDHIDLPAFRLEQATARAQGRYLGIGIAAYIEPTTMATAGILATDSADIRIDPRGKAIATVSTHSQGHGTETTMAQLIADELGLDIADISVHEDDSTRGGFGPGAGGSRQAVSGGGATILASRRLGEKIKAIAAFLYNANVEAISLRGGRVEIAGAPEMSRTIREIAEVAYYTPERLPPGFDAGLESTMRYRPPPVVFSNAAHACVVEIDAMTGNIQVLRWVVCEDCGPMINPAIVEGQIAGGIAQSIGSVLYEQIHYDEVGNPTTATFKDYLLPLAQDVPAIEFLHIETLSHSEGGFKGVGEGGLIIGPPTLVNAVNDALASFEAECLTLPFSPDRVLSALSAIEARPAFEIIQSRRA